MHDAPADPDAPAGVQFTGLPRAAVPFLNCTVPLGPAALLLLDEMVAVKVTLPPEAMLAGLEVTAAVVAAFVMVTERIFEVLAL